MSTVAQRARLGDTTVEQAIEEGFQQGFAQAMADGIISRQEKERLRAFRDHLPFGTTQPARTPSGTWNRCRDTAS